MHDVVDHVVVIVVVHVMHIVMMAIMVHVVVHDGRWCRRYGIRLLGDGRRRRDHRSRSRRRRAGTRAEQRQDAAYHKRPSKVNHGVLPFAKLLID
jgi:hypothetical protein